MESAPASDLPTIPAAPSLWRAGTLTYTRSGLVRLGFWLMFGQFTFNLEYVAMPVLLPLLFKSKGFTTGQIGTLLSVFPLGALIVVPIIGTWSDGLRTRWGRRRPIDFLAAPFWFAGLCWLPFADTYWQALAAMALIGFAGAGANLLNSLYNDVIPPSLLGRFVGVMSFFGTLGALAFQLVGLRYFDRHPAATFIVLATVGFVGEMLLLIMVREGEYPPEPAKPILKTITGFLAEGFANRYIVFFWLTMGLTALGGPVMGNFFNLFLQDSLRLTSAEIGKVLSTGTAVGLLLIIPSGWLIDAFGPRRIWVFGAMVVGAAQIAMYCAAGSRAAIHGLYTVYAATNTLLTAALLPMMYAFIPQQKFGQVNGAGQIAVRAMAIAGAAGCGYFIQASHNQYSLAFVLGGFFYLLTPLGVWLIRRQQYPYPRMPTSMRPDGRRSHPSRDVAADSLAYESAAPSIAAEAPLSVRPQPSNHHPL